jgi:hypothetical protein
MMRRRWLSRHDPVFYSTALLDYNANANLRSVLVSDLSNRMIQSASVRKYIHARIIQPKEVT